MIELYSWTPPSKPIIDLPIVRRWSPRRRLVNFGDELGPIVVRGMLARLGLLSPEAAQASGRLVSVGSVMHFLRPGDHVWGTGINGKTNNPVRVVPGEVQIYAVRGPRTRKALIDRGFDVPPVFGDPALLIADVDRRFQISVEKKTRKITVIPNLNEIGRFRGTPGFVSPLQSPEIIARAIAASDFVVASSLHALILADVLGVPARWLESEVEQPFKYVDYFEGTDREPPEPATNIEHAHRLGAMEPYQPGLQALIDSFPTRLFAS